jgi:BirA family biotin operon repressor/biotin-[acetyl-CoA-carboxylase] ligase
MPSVPAKAIQRPWTDLCTAVGRPIDRNTLAAGVLDQLAGGLQQIDRDGMSDWLDRWRQRDWLKGRSVVVDGSPPVSGQAAGIDDAGALIVETDHGPAAVSGGEASLLSIGGLT